MLTINEINGWSLDKCNEELGAACHYSQHNDVHEAREAVVAMAVEMGTLPKMKVVSKALVSARGDEGRPVTLIAVQVDDYSLLLHEQEYVCDGDWLVTSRKASRLDRLAYVPENARTLFVLCKMQGKSVVGASELAKKLQW